jgi:hypothetical protein
MKALTEFSEFVGLETVSESSGESPWDTIDKFLDEAEEVVFEALDALSGEGKIPAFPDEDAPEEQVRLFSEAATKGSNTKAYIVKFAEVMFGGSE